MPACKVLNFYPSTGKLKARLRVKVMVKVDLPMKVSTFLYGDGTIGNGLVYANSNEKSEGDES